LTAPRGRADHGAVRPRRRPHRLVAALLVAFVLALVAPAAAEAAPRQEEPGTTEDTTTDVTPVPDQRIIPLPNSGHEPTDAGDPGGVGQVLVFAGILVALGVIVLSIRRDVRRGRRGSAPRAGQPSQSGP
jgi:hypothetical protein